MVAFLLCELLVPAISLIHRTGSFVYRLFTQPTDDELLSDTEP